MIITRIALHCILLTGTSAGFHWIGHDILLKLGTALTFLGACQLDENYLEPADIFIAHSIYYSL